MGSSKRTRTPESDSTLSAGSQGNADWPASNSGSEAQNSLTSRDVERVVTPELFSREYSHFPSAVPPPADVNQSHEHMAPVSRSFPFQTSNAEVA